MNKHKTNRIWFALTILVLGVLACQPGGNGPVATPTPVQTEPTPVATNNSGLSSEDRTNLVNATVQVLMQIKQGGEFVSFNWGSGTIISTDGLIVTNAHVASPASQGDPDNEPDRLVISMIESEDKPPVPAYVAIVKAVDGYLDLAVLQIISTVDGSSVDTANLNLPFVELGNPDEIHIGDHLNIFGFPSIGGDTITYTDGNASGFASDDQIGDRAWIKTDATISGGNSGGLAADDNGQIVGVPTSLGASGSGMDCRPQQDTNDDGQVDNGDFCVPISNFIADVRPINFAKALIDTAQSGREYASPYRLPGQVTEAGSGEEAVTDFVWLDTSNSKDSCKNTDDGVGVDSYPANALCIWTYFNYSGMTDGEQVRELWYNNAERVSEAAYSWESGSEGSIGTYLGNAGDSMPAGEYYLEMYAGDDDHLIGTSDKVVVGDGSSSETPAPTQEDTVTVYGVIFDAATNKPIAGGYVYVVQGVTYEEWAGEKYDEKYLVATPLQVGQTGEYEITGIPRGIPLTYVFSAEGYFDASGDNIVIPVDDPATRWELNAEMSK